MTRKPIGLTSPYRHVDKSPVRWPELIHGVRVDENKVIITVKGGNEAARFVCGEILKEKQK